MLIEIQQMVSCLRHMQTQQSQSHRERLVQICLDPQMILAFKFILEDTSLEEKTKQMAVIFVKNYFDQRYTDFDEVFFVEFIVSIVMSQKISYKIKVLLQETIVKMLDWIEKETLNQLIQCLQNSLNSLQKASGKEIVRLEKRQIQKKTNLDKTKLNLSKYSQFNFQNQTQFINMAFSLIHLIECFASTENVQTQDLHRVIRISLPVTLTIFSLQNSEEYLRLHMVIIHMWLLIIEALELKSEKSVHLNPILRQIMEEEYLWNKIIEIYSFQNYDFTNQGNNLNKMLVCSPEQKHKNIINKMKNYACQIHLKIVKYEKEETDESKFLNKTIDPNIFTIVIKTLSFFSIDKGMIYKCECQEFINSLLSLFIFVCQLNPETIDTNWNNLLHMIIFPLLTTSQKELYDFQQNPEEFNRLAQDCCDKQLLGELKTQAARFLEIVCDRNTEHAKYIIQFCIISIQTYILKQQIPIQNKVSLLPLQTAFLVLAVCSYNLGQHPTQLIILNKILTDPNCMQVSPLQASRVFLFLAYNTTQVFSSILDCRTWIYFAMNGQMHQTTKLSAYDFLINILQDFYQEEFLIQFSSKILTQNSLKQIWQILNKYLNYHLQQIKQSTMVIVIEKIQQRLSSEITRYKNKQIKTTMNINSGLQLMRKILINQTYCSDKPKLLQQIWKVVPLYKTFKGLNLQDVILKIINQFMQRQQDKVDPVFQNMLPQILQQFRSDQYRTTAFYWIFNQFIFKESFEKLTDIKNVLVEALNYLYLSYLSNKKKVMSNLPIAHTLLLIQHMLMIHGEKFTPEEIANLFDTCVSFLPQDFHQPQRINLSPYIIGRTLIVMTISQMLSRNEQNLTIDKINALKYLLIFHDQDQVFTGHNSSVIVKLLCKQLFRQSDPVWVTQMINMMVRIIRPNQKNIDKMVKSHSTHKKYPLKIKLKQRQNYEVILNKIKSPFDFTINAQEQLKKALALMRDNNQLLYRSMINQLPTEIKEKLRDMLTTSTLNTVQQSNQVKQRKIIKIGGVRQTQEGKVFTLKQRQSLNRSKKRFAHFQEQQNQQQHIQEISENQLILQNTSQNVFIDDEERKNKLKKSKKMKKLKQNEFQTHQQHE